MGALTLKSFPFELRGWDIEKFNSIDPTDGFGSNTRVYISKQQIIQIEPDYNKTRIISNFWLSDKGRQFFDSFKNKKKWKKNSWNYILKSLFKTLYFFEFCKNKSQQNYYFTVVIENSSIEILSLLIIFLQNYSFIKIKRSEKIKLNNDLESNFQLNFTNKKTNLLEKSTLVLLIANNPRNESYLLNLSLKQRFFKGDFKCFVVGSIIDLTFPINFLGTKLTVFKNITEGNSLLCQDLKSANNPSLIFNAEMFKRNDGKNIIKMIKLLNYSNSLNKLWNFNILNNLYETGLQNTINFSYLSLKDLSEFSSFYFLNLTNNNICNFKKIAEIKLLNCNKKYLQTNKLFIDQTNLKKNDNLNFYYKKLLRNKKFNKYLYLPIKMFYETEENFINTQGFIKTSLKLVLRKDIKNGWKLLRNCLNNLKNNLFLNFKNNLNIVFNLKKQSKFKHFILFHFNASYIINSYFFVLFNNKPIYINKNKYKIKKLKLFCTKIKNWLDDFFIGGKDGYSHNSLTLTHCSKIQRFQKTNFF